MIKSEKKLKDLDSILHKDNNILISEAIISLRDEQPFEGAIGLLTSYYDETEDISIKRIIEEFMNDLKDQSVCEEVINEIRKEWKSDTTSMLISSCWQSGLDYSEYSLDMAKVFLKGDYVTAIECLTVIEESAGELSKVKKDEIAKLIQESRVSAAKEKRELIFELLSILDR
jgi:predicted DNA-binding protein